MHSKLRSLRLVGAVWWCGLFLAGPPDGWWLGRGSAFTVVPDNFFFDFRVAEPDPTKVEKVGTLGQPLGLVATVRDPGTANDPRAGWMEIRGLTSAGRLAEQVHRNSAWFELCLFNDTGADWTSVTFELQTTKGFASPQPDGLSFADISAKKAASLGLNSENPFEFRANVMSPTGRAAASSDTLPDPIEIDPDRMAFKVSVPSGHEANFWFIISQNGYTDPVWLRVQVTANVIPELESTGLACFALAGLSAARFWRRRR